MWSGQVSHHRTMRTAREINGQHPHCGTGKRPMAVVVNIPGGCSPDRKPYRQPQGSRRNPSKAYGRSRGSQQFNSPGETSTMDNRDEMPPLEEEEAIEELDAAIDEAGDEGEEEPKPLDEADIKEAAHYIKDDPMLYLALGLTDPYWASMALVVDVQKLHEYQAHKNHWKRSQVLSYGKLVNHYSVNKDQLQEISVMGNCGRNPRSVRPDKMREWWCSNSNQSWKAIPPPQDRTPHRCISIARNSQSFSGPPLHSQSEISFEKLFL